MKIYINPFRQSLLFVIFSANLALNHAPPLPGDFVFDFHVLYLILSFTPNLKPPMQLFFQEDISEGNFELNAEESRHLIKVLRKSVGDTVFFTNGKGGLYTCRIKDLNLKNAKLEVLEVKNLPQDDHYIHLAIAPTKNQDRLEWMVEKITEIGFHEITFLYTHNTEKNFLKAERLEKKIVAACKQSLKTWKPRINEAAEFPDFIASPQFKDFQKFIGYVDEENKSYLKDLATKNASYLILIGPEGDFSPKEIQLALETGFLPCSLGKSRLRTETAGLVAVNTLNLINL